MKPVIDLPQIIHKEPVLPNKTSPKRLIEMFLGSKNKEEFLKNHKDVIKSLSPKKQRQFLQLLKEFLN